MTKQIDIKDKKVAVIGISGMEGYAAAKFLINKGVKVIGHDFATKEELKANFFNLRDYLSDQEKELQWQEFRKLKLKLRLKNQYLTDIKKADLIFLPQAWFRYSFNNKLKQLKKTQAKAFIGILDLYFSFCQGQIIGVTGSSGKTTTTQLIYNIVKTEKKALISGNDRKMLPVLDKIETLKEDDYLILEISNRQLIDFKYSPDISVITNLFPTHLDDHGSLKAYKYVKANLIRNQNKDQVAILNFDDREVMDMASQTKAKKYFFSLNKKPEQGSIKQDDKAIWLGAKDQPEEVLEFDKVNIPGEHNQANILVGVITGKLVGISNQAIAQAVYDFKGLEHRLELVAEKNGIKFYNDSQSTNPLSAIAAIKSFSKPIFLIVGGKRKPNPDDFDILAKETLQTSNVKQVLLIGEAAGQIKSSFKKFASEQEIQALVLSIFKDLKAAVKQAKELVGKGDIVLLSPSTESFGEFKDYRERGKKFKKYSQGL